VSACRSGDRELFIIGVVIESPEQLEPVHASREFYCYVEWAAVGNFAPWGNVLGLCRK
jgi:hypothetical protein